AIGKELRLALAAELDERIPEPPLIGERRRRRDEAAQRRQPRHSRRGMGRDARQVTRLASKAREQALAEPVIAGAHDERVEMLDPGDKAVADDIGAPGGLFPGIAARQPIGRPFPRLLPRHLAADRGDVGEPGIAVHRGQPLDTMSGGPGRRRGARRLAGKVEAAREQGVAARGVARPGLAETNGEVRRSAPPKAQVIDRRAVKDGLRQRHQPTARAAPLPRRRSILAAYAAAPPLKVAVPATRTSAPASRASCAVSTVMPPSTSRSMRRPLVSMRRRRARILSSCEAMNFCPPKPGLTLITRMRSTKSRTLSTASTGVAGLSETPAFLPSDLMSCSVRWR